MGKKIGQKVPKTPKRAKIRFSGSGAPFPEAGPKGQLKAPSLTIYTAILIKMLVFTRKSVCFQTKKTPIMKKSEDSHWETKDKDHMKDNLENQEISGPCENAFAHHSITSVTQWFFLV